MLLLYGFMWIVGQFAYPAALVLWVPMVLVVVKIFSVSVRRLHDIELSAWWMLLFVIPLAGLIFGLFLGLKPGDRYNNRYGEKGSSTGLTRV